jgi:hypothetical protein
MTDTPRHCCDVDSNGKEIVSSFIQEDDADLRSCALRLVEILILDDAQLTYGYELPLQWWWPANGV